MEERSSQQALNRVFNLLKFTFVIVPIVAGADKFTNLLTHWDQYLNPAIASLLPFPAATFMMIVGVIEIIAGIVVLKNAEIGGYIVAAWLTSIALTLLLGFIYIDVAVRDLVMAISAFSMAKISRIVS
ncbi:hypothetical protein GCM10023091_32480 [Ravibacter arvi]|uniref:tRNA (5-methylaminomethyl-2-thiouridylate)-methyltransferase n=1 Tax=Ravibacter arvi TaxID=2051041 RepID=A0ABP8M539_9BACT